MIFGMTMYQMLWYFMIYSVLGWAIEVCYHAVTLGKVVNRGFLNGPVCPVYGSGVIMVLIVLYEIGQLFGIDTDLDSVSTSILFIIGIIFATFIELVAGFLLDKLFHARWWDYSNNKFNLNGYICLEFSIIWGLAIAFVLRIVQPCFESLVDFIPKLPGMILLIVFYLIFIADIVITVLTVLRLNKELEKMQTIQNSINKISDQMSELIGNTTIKAMDKLSEEKVEMAEKTGDIIENIQDKRNEYELKKAELEDKFEHIKKEIMYQKIFGTRRLLIAFPNIKHQKFQKQLEILLSKYKSIR
ncbi:MAG: putative ABC transporter permease [Eubacterium sp.]|nr:putative ABC transporter permease [Eubacterium sp.]